MTLFVLLALLAALPARPGAAEQSMWSTFLLNEPWSRSDARLQLYVPTWAPPAGGYRTRLVWLVAAGQGVQDTDARLLRHEIEVELTQLRRMPPGPRSHYVAKMSTST